MQQVQATSPSNAPSRLGGTAVPVPHDAPDQLLIPATQVQVMQPHGQDEPHVPQSTMLEPEPEPEPDPLPEPEPEPVPVPDPVPEPLPEEQQVMRSWPANDPLTFGVTALPVHPRPVSQRTQADPLHRQIA